MPGRFVLSPSLTGCLQCRRQGSAKVCDWEIRWPRPSGKAHVGGIHHQSRSGWTSERRHDPEHPPGNMPGSATPGGQLLDECCELVEGEILTTDLEDPSSPT